jgi:hypothetical protein
MMIADLVEISSQSPEPRSVSGDGLYTPSVCMCVCVCVCWGGLQPGVLPVTGKQVGYRIATPHPLIECGYSYRKPCKLAGGVQ